MTWVDPSVCACVCEPCRLKARHGVKIIGAKSSNESQWQIALDLSHKLHGAVVTAAVVDRHSMHFPSDRSVITFCFGDIAAGYIAVTC